MPIVATPPSSGSAAAPPAPSMVTTHRPELRRESGAPHNVLHWLWPAFALAVATLALATLRHELHAYHYHEITRAAFALPTTRLWGAVVCTILGYGVLAAYDALALEYVGHRLAPRRTLFASFVAYALSMNVGFSAITGASIRYRFWSSWGLSAPETAQGVAFTTSTFCLAYSRLVGWRSRLAPSRRAWPARCRRPPGISSVRCCSSAFSRTSCGPRTSGAQ